MEYSKTAGLLPIPLSVLVTSDKPKIKNTRPIV